jgi:hypothetical protein
VPVLPQNEAVVVDRSLHRSSVAQSVEQSAVNRSVGGSSPSRGAIITDGCPRGRRSTIGNRVGGDNSSRGFKSHSIRHHGPLVKRFNTAAFHAVIQGFESPTGHHVKRWDPHNVIGIRFKAIRHFVGCCGGLAQLGEHLPYKQRVGGSIPSASTITVEFQSSRDGAVW